MEASVIWIIYWFNNRVSVRITAIGTFCLLYTSDAADDSLRVDLGGRRIIKK